MLTRNDAKYLQWVSEMLGKDSMFYGDLLEVFFSVEFVDIVPNDDNRLQEGLAIREEYVRKTGEPYPSIGYCSLLEVVVGISRRISEAVYNPDQDTRASWFWVIVDNLGLLGYTDETMDPISREDVRGLLKNVVSRSYKKNGSGGLFPLLRPLGDQREVELWYQMDYWLAERGY